MISAGFIPFPAPKRFPFNDAEKDWANLACGPRVPGREMKCPQRWQTAGKGMARAGLAVARARVERYRSREREKNLCHDLVRGESYHTEFLHLPGTVHFLNPQGAVAWCGLGRFFLLFCRFMKIHLLYLKIYLIASEQLDDV